MTRGNSAATRSLCLIRSAKNYLHDSQAICEVDFPWSPLLKEDLAIIGFQPSAWYRLPEALALAADFFSAGHSESESAESH